MADHEKQLSLAERWQKLVWDHDPKTLNPFQLLLVRQLQAAALVGRDFMNDRCLLQASALTYSSMLAIVPLLALTFALLKAFGVQNRLEPLIMEKLSVGSEDVIQSIVGYINNTQVASLGALGLVLLLVAVVSLLTNVEKSFNHIWGVSGTRSLLRRFSDYLSVILVGPVLLISAMSMTTSLASHDLVQRFLEMEVVGSVLLLLFKVTPYLFMWLAFAILYIFMSNTKVELKAALIGGIFGGTLWQLAQWAYVNFQVGVAKYNAIYGTMAALPIFMVWLYLSWLIVLLGLEVTYAKQNLRVSGYDLRDEEVSILGHEQSSLAILVVLAERFIKGDSPLSQGELAQLLVLPPRLCGSVLTRLDALGFVSEACPPGSSRCRYQLGRAADTLPVMEILQKLRSYGEELPLQAELKQVQVALEVYASLEKMEQEGLAGMTLRELCLREESV
ncbi:MAG TPA: YihY/virulence factor BrkB family protein [Geopsychrobacteraceae bacterium]|nr:YihY/virulence factor BrkB family protein [Geopsychrobacteraceae bacterium]